MPFSRPHKHFVSLLRSSASRVHNAGCWIASRTQDFGKSLWACIGGGKGEKAVYLLPFI